MCGVLAEQVQSKSESESLGGTWRVSESLGESWMVLMGLDGLFEGVCRTVVWDCSASGVR